MSQATPGAQSAPASSPSYHVPLIDLTVQFTAVRQSVSEAIERVFSTQQFVLGEEVERCEERVARYCDARFAIGCASGSDALLLGLMALGISPGDEVLTTPYSFFSTASAIARLGARPVFVDIRPESYNLNTELLEDHITARTRAFLPVHLFGQCCEMDPLWRTAVRHGLPIVEDSAQAIGADYCGRRAGVLGTAAAISFFPTKNLGAFGDAGMVTTDDGELARRVRRLRVHGMEPKYHHHEIGINSRLDALHAAVLTAKLPYLERWIRARQRNAVRYGELFEQCHLLEAVQLPAVLPDRRHVFNQYVIRVRDGQRDALVEHLHSKGIGCEVYYPIPLHLQPCFAYLDYQRGAFPEAERAAAETVALPIYPELTTAQQVTVVSAVGDFFHHRRRRDVIRRPAFLRHTNLQKPGAVDGPVDGSSQASSA